ncbi:MAG: phosphopantothenoylcysteine decarboxylase, partial [Pseudomonadota bacterium]
AVDAVIEGADVFIAAAAVSDYRPATFETQKIKKTKDSLSLALARNPDILAGVASRAPRPFTVGFAAETTDVIVNARDKLERKGLDMIIANRVGDGLAFDRDDNAVTVLWAGGEQAFARDAKTRLAQSLVALIGERVTAA